MGGASLAVRQGGGGARWARLGQERGNGPAGREKEKGGGMGWAGKGFRGKGRVFHFQKRFQTLSIQIQTLRFEFRLNSKQNKMQRQHEMQQNLFFLYFFYG